MQSLFHVFIDKKKKVTAFQTLFRYTHSNKRHPRVTGMVPHLWVKGHAGGCGCPLGRPTPPPQHLCPFLPYTLLTPLRPVKTAETKSL